MTANYFIITTAACEPSYAQEALELLGPLVRDLKERANCVGARYGTIATGSEAGSLGLFQSYAGLADIEKVFKVYATSSAYQQIIQSGKLSVTRRNIVKLENVQISNPSNDTPKYGVVTVLDSPTLTSERMQGLMSTFEQNGAMLVRYGTLITGSNAGKRLAGAHMIFNLTVGTIAILFIAPLADLVDAVAAHSPVTGRDGHDERQRQQPG